MEIWYLQCSLLLQLQAEEKLRGTFSGDKNELLFSQFGINYNNESELVRKGTVLIRKKVPVVLENGETRAKSQIVEQTTDLISDHFWTENEHLLKP